MGGINHWAYIIQMLRHFVIILPYNGSIQFAVNYNPVYICRQGNSHIMQLLCRIDCKLRYDILLVLLQGILSEIHL